jgi:hypothetical protein
MPIQALEKTMRAAMAPGKINVSHILGEAGTGFEEAGGLGEFECGNCYFYANDGGCGQQEMKMYSKRPRLADGRVKVGEEDCCEYLKRVGRKDDD